MNQVTRLDDFKKKGVLVRLESISFIMIIGMIEVKYDNMMFPLKTI